MASRCRMGYLLPRSLLDPFAISKNRSTSKRILPWPRFLASTATHANGNPLPINQLWHAARQIGPAGRGEKYTDLAEREAARMLRK
jgi:hypothetical protein